LSRRRRPRPPAPAARPGKSSFSCPVLHFQIHKTVRR